MKAKRTSACSGRPAMQGIALILSIAALAGCAAQPTECLTVRTVGLSVASTDPRIPATTITPTTTTVCVTPASIERSAAAQKEAAP